MQQLITTNGYEFNTELNIWSRPQYQGIPYSDGDEVENKVKSIIANATDISVMSDELRQNCTDWPTHYYLNKDRVNLLRPFAEQLKNADVLEIGAGCGAITRFLGECQANVFALEGSIRRASIAKSRCRDLPNVEVVSENFTEFKLNHQFDVITLIGVLEYANWFTPGSNPALEMLKKVRGFLKPNGVLIIAIENQVGLKYYAGAPEDHLGVRMVGVEGLYKNNGPQTFGRHVLIEMLKEAGFSSSQFTAPFPDYKLPVALITEAGFKHPQFKAADLAAQTVIKDRQVKAPFAFSQESAWGPLFDNQVALDLSNSFLITAGADADQINIFNKNEENNLAYYYSSNRLASYCKETTFKSNTNNQINIFYKSLNKSNNNFIENFDENIHLKFSPKETANYYSHEYESFSQALQRVVKTKNWNFSDLASIIENYLFALEELSQIKGFAKPFNKNTKLPSKYFDAITHNVLFNKDTKEAVLIDEEWQSSFEPTAGYLVFRSFLSALSELTLTACSAETTADNTKGILEGVFKALNADFLPEDIELYESLEIKIQKQVSGLKILNSGWWFAPKQIIVKNALDLYDDILAIVDSYVPAIDKQNSHILNLDIEITKLNNFKIDLETGNREANKVINNLTDQVAEMYSHILHLDNIIDQSNKSNEKLNYEIIELKSNKHQFEDLLLKNESLFTSVKNNNLNHQSFHERLLRIYNSKLWRLSFKIRSFINILTN
jgi:2-polyprenyl-3-methyl-5-hydroxy-6-metoxy-1,4-benzoquinol methylase